jgi:hypothetical protein
MSDLLVERRRVISQGSGRPVRDALHVVRGSKNILAIREILLEFSERCGQPGTMDDLSYFLSKPGLLKRVPCLFLMVKRQNLKVKELTVDDLVGALFLYEVSVLGFGMRAFATNDRSGRGTMLALPEERLRVAAQASRVLLDRGAHMIMLSFQPGNEETVKDREALEVPPLGRITAKWAWRERVIPAYLALEESYDATLAKLGSKTRRNLRYYQRKAEAQLGCTLVAEVEIGREEFLAFNRECMYPVRDYVAMWRYDTQKTLSEPVLMGMKDKEGRWLGILGGRRHKDRMEVLWQMNRAGLSTYSLSTVMRAYCMENEIRRRMKRLYFEGGTGHSLNHSFVKEELMDLVVVRRSMLAKWMKMLAKRTVSPDNELADVLKDPGIEWLSC